MTRQEYELIFQAFKNYRVYMNDEQEVLSEKILDDLFYPSFDSLEGAFKNDDLEETAGDLPVLEIPEDLEEDTSEIKSLNFR